MNLGDIGNWLQKTFTPKQTIQKAKMSPQMQQTLQQNTPSFMNRVQQTLIGGFNTANNFVSAPFDRITKGIQQYQTTQPVGQRTGLMAGIKSLPEVTKIVTNNLYKDIPVANEITNYVGNRIAAPLMEVPASFAKAGESIGKKDYWGAAGNISMGGLNALYSYGNIVNPIGTQAAMAPFLGIDAAKGAFKSIRQGDNSVDQFKAAINGFTGQTVTGLGDMLTDDKKLAQNINTIETVAMLAIPALNGIQGYVNKKQAVSSAYKNFSTDMRKEFLKPLPPDVNESDTMKAMRLIFNASDKDIMNTKRVLQAFESKPSNPEAVSNLRMISKQYLNAAPESSLLGLKNTWDYLHAIRDGVVPKYTPVQLRPLHETIVQNFASKPKMQMAESSIELPQQGANNIKIVPTKQSTNFQKAVEEAMQKGHITPTEGRLLLKQELPLLEGQQVFTMKKNKPVQGQVNNFTPIKIKEMVTKLKQQNKGVEEYIQVLRDQGLNDDADRLLNAITLKSNGINEPLAKIKPKTGFTPLDEASLQKGYRNQDSGLPVEGLNPQAQQKKSLIANASDYLIKSGRKDLQNMGEAGQSMARKFDVMYTDAQRNAGGKVADYLKVVNNMDDVTHSQLIDTLRGTENGFTKSSKEVQAVRKILDKVQADAKAVGLDVGYLENYVPQKVDMDKLKLNREAAIQYFADKKTFSYDKATQFVDDILNGTDIQVAYNRFGKQLPKKMGNLEFERILDWAPEVLRNDKKLIADYIEQAYSRIEQTRQFGKNNEIGNNLITNIQRQGYNSQLAKTIMEQNLGLRNYEGSFLSPKASGVIRSVQGAVKLPLAAITNATQSVNTMTVGGVRRTLGQMFKYANPKNRAAMEEFSLRTGATLNGNMQRIMEEWQGSPNALKRLIAPFFGEIENFNRTIAANVGKEKALAEGVTNKEALLKAGQKMVDTTQFQVRPLDLPPSWDSPLGKVATQFKSFGFRQAEFVMDQVVKTAMKGDLKPLARFLLVGTLAGEISNNVKSIFTRKARPEELTARIIQDLPGMGFYQDFLEAVDYGLKASSYDKSALPNAIRDFIIGPTGADIFKLAGNVGQAYQGRPGPLLKEAVNTIPFVGRPFVNENPQLFGSKAPIKISTTGTTGTTTGISTGDSTLLDKQRISDQITELNKQKKAIYDQAGVNVFGQNFGTMSDQEKIQKMTQLETQIKALETQKKMMDVKFEMPTSPQLTGNTELDKKLVSKYKGQLTTEANDILKLYEAGMMTKDEAEKNLAQIKGVVSSFAAAKKPKKITMGKIKIPKISNIKVKTFKPKKIKMPKQPKLLTSKRRKSTFKIKA